MAIEVENSDVKMLVGTLGRFMPEPKNGLGFGSVLNAVDSVLGGSDVVTHNLSPQYQAFLELQMEVQTQMQEVNLSSNVEKTKHETRMAPIRNIRAG